MSFLSKLFGGKKNQDQAPSPEEAIQRLRDNEEMLMKKIEYLEKQVEQELATAKKNGTTNKRVALQALKRKKRYEKQLTQIDGTLTTIEFQREALENANTNTEVLKIMDIAAKALKNAHLDMDIDKVHDLMDEVQEQQDISKEISEAISRNDVDENELNRELEELEQESLDEELISVAGRATENLPSPPTALPGGKRKVKAEEDDVDLKELPQLAS